MRRDAWRRRLVWTTALLLTAVATGAAHEPEETAELPGPQQPPRLVPQEAELARSVRMAVDDRLLTEAERNELRIQHGLFDEVTGDARESGAFALARYDLHHPVLQDDATAPHLRARAALRRGDVHQVIDQLAGDRSVQGRWLHGRALAEMGRFEEAAAVLRPIREQARGEALEGAAEATAAAEAIALLAELEGRPAADYHFVMELLSRAQQELDRLHWPALVAQGRLLKAKDNRREAVAALHEALRLNPRASEAWYVLGRVALGAFDFDGAMQAVMRLRDVQPHHILADLLEIEIYLTQRDAASAEPRLLEALLRYPNHRRLLALSAATAALQYDEEGTQAALEQFERVAGDHPLALFLTGRYLSQGRQYEAAERKLRAALQRQPNWTAPLVELGLLLNQAGRDEAALEVLRRATRLDPFNMRAANTLRLVEELVGYERLETDHFVIKYRDAIDGVLAADMAPFLEEIYEELTRTYQHEPRFRTQMEILPDRRWFAIRITGMPWIWTIGACTGPVIAVTPPREGAHHAGPYDWARVVRHEFVHTVTLDKTHNRVPHWFTEACAVAEERVPRDYQTCRLLARALRNGELFDLEQINWAFVRPRRQEDRTLAYAQSHWMYDYITERFGHETILQILRLSGEGMPQARLVPEATGLDEDRFLEGFHAWARQQVEAWGLAPVPPAEELVTRIREAEDAERKLAELLDSYPEHPDLLRLASERALEAGSWEEAEPLLRRYAEARPVDAWADRQLAELALREERWEEAVPHLQRLDQLDQRHGRHAVALKQLHRQLGRLDEAQKAAARALDRQPYDPKLREDAATIALQRGDSDLALTHLRALTRIEPDRAIHFTRLAALHHRLEQSGEAAEAAQRALELDPGAPAERFLNPPGP